MNRIQQQLDFLIEIDKLKSIERRVKLCGGSRHENSAEHSWHVALMAITFQEYAASSLDMSRVVQMLLLHDIVEIDAGDTFCYDEVGYSDKEEREAAAAQRIFGLLPDEQAIELQALWEEFENCETAEAIYANSIDRLGPIFHNYQNQGGSWIEHGIKRSQVIKRISLTEQLPALWEHTLALLDDAVSKGYLLADD